MRKPDGTSDDFRFYVHSDVTDELLGLALRDPAQSTLVSRWQVRPQPDEGYYAHTDHQGSVRAITDGEAGKAGVDGPAPAR